jgi:ubiquitin carboxyl-terminal hydrolase MINDY-1/2
MAYSLKEVRYKERQCHILLQNQNGPCPLIAVCNCLLLRHDIQLPTVAIRHNIASIDDVVNTLANHALHLYSTSNDSGNATENGFHVDELLKLFPTLQYGMDVNPKFLSGPTGVEYTSGVGAFDLMNVELVHGWLIDIQEETRVSVIGNKTYNELTEMIIMGNEAAFETNKIQSQIDDLQQKINHGIDDNTSAKDDADNVDGKDDSAETLNLFHSQLEELKKTLAEKTQVFEDGSIVQDFLEETSHQLTYTGLAELTQRIKEGDMCVFFRNNHFATITKFENTLYLLVTDLGYANHPDIMWEKLDDINGDTEYFDETFKRTKQHVNIEVGRGSSLTPEEVLAQSSAQEADYRLAVQLSQNENAVEEQEKKMIAAATEASLHEYNQTHQEDNGINMNMPVSSIKEEPIHEIESRFRQESAHVAANRAREEHDYIVAMQLQAQLDEQAAASEAVIQRQQRQNQMERRRNNIKRKEKESCVIC